jgi:transposase-like protein
MGLFGNTRKKLGHGRSYSAEEYEEKGSRKTWGQEGLETDQFQRYGDREENSCPSCGELTKTKASGRDRFTCNKCDYRFSATTGTEFHKSRLSKDQILKLKECVRENLSARQTAEIVGINKNTADRYLNILEDIGASQLEEALEKSYRQQEAHSRLQQELLDEQD